MYAAMSDAWLPHLFAWIVPLMGGDFAVRQWHHMVMWFFIIFTMVHVYLVFYHDYVEGRGVISSMAGGWKFVEKECKPENAMTTEDRLSWASATPARRRGHRGPGRPAARRRDLAGAGRDRRRGHGRFSASLPSPNMPASS